MEARFTCGSGLVSQEKRPFFFLSLIKTREASSNGEVYIDSKLSAMYYPYLQIQTAFLI